MDYVVGSVAALISGNVTPNRPKLLRRALTPTKHQASPNVTPKSELVLDRSIFLSPTMQKKKAVVKKSPKRIFQNTDLDATDGEESTRTSPKADKVKKHLKDDLDADDAGNSTLKSPDNKFNKSSGNVSQKKGKKNSIVEDIREINESTPKKKKKLQIAMNETVDPMVLNTKSINNDIAAEIGKKSPKKKNKSNKSLSDAESIVIEMTTDATSESNTKNQVKSPKKKNKKKNNKSDTTANMEIDKQNNTTENSNEISEEKQEPSQTNQNSKKKNKKQRKKPKKQSKPDSNQVELKDTKETQEESTEETEVEPTKKKKNYVNPNAITEQDTDSEHESDDEIESETEEINKDVLDEANTEPAEDSSDDEEEKSQKPEKEVKEKDVATEDEVKRTIFVGNVPFSSKCKKEIKKIFSKHGPIETVRIRTVPVKDARVTPKLAVIKNELHPERSTVNVYVKFRDQVCVENALSENNSLLNGNHLRVTRSEHSGAEHEPARSVFVGNLPFALEDDALRDKFQGCGEIHSVRIIRDKKTNAGKGFGYVNFASKDGVELALALSEEDLTIKNRILRVKRCTPTQKKPQTHQQQRQQNRPQQGRNVQNGGFKKGGNQAGNQRGGFNKFGGKPGQFGGKPGQFGGKPGQFGGKPGQFGGKPGQDEVGAFRRIQNKRKYQEGNAEGPPNKRQKDINQPIKEKKTRKEFVGMTAEKKKKNKFDKGQKKKKALSEILTK